MMVGSYEEDDGSCSSISIDSNNAFAFVDFSGVDFGDDDESQEKAVKESTGVNSSPIKEQKKSKKNQKQKRQDAQQPDEISDGQKMQERHQYDPQLFKAQERRIQNLCRWHELGIRPSLSSSSLINLMAHQEKDEDLFASEVDDLAKLNLRIVQAHDELNYTNLPQHPHGKDEDKLKVAPSTIEAAGKGLFATSPISKGTTVCYYAGYRHHYQSQKRLKNRAYILQLENGWSKFDRQNDGFVDAFPTMDVIARFINDPRIEEQCNVKFEHIQQVGIWHCPVVAQRDILAGEELFISYGSRYWSEQEN